MKTKKKRAKPKLNRSTRQRKNPKVNPWKQKWLVDSFSTTIFSISYRSTGGYRAIETDLELNIYIVRLVKSTPANSICSERHSRVLVDDF